jgi:hypothetical protein
LEQQFDCPNCNNEDKDLKGLENSLNGLAKAEGRVIREMVSNPRLNACAGKVTHDPVQRAQTIKAQRKAHATIELLQQNTTLAMLDDSNN